MNQKLNMVSNLFSQTQSDITDNINSWQDFLTTASRLAKYSFSDQLLIFAQRPQATACANMELWNNKMNRWIKSGSKGIALIRQNTGQKPRLEYVFDLADTRQIKNGRTPYLWEMREEFHAPVIERFSEMYGDIPDTVDFATTLMEYCARVAGENYREFLHDLTYDLEDSFLEGFDELNVDVAFCNAITVSTQYMVLSRCGFNPKKYLNEDDFRVILEFNTTTVLSHLGNALNRVSSEVLLIIGDIAKKIEIEKSRNSLDNSRETSYTGHKERFTVLKTETNNIEEEHSYNEHINLQRKWGLSNSEPSNGGGQFTGNSGQIWDVEGNTSEKPQEWYLHQNVNAGYTLGASGGDRQHSTGTSGRTNRADDERTEREREPKSERPDVMGTDGYGNQGTGGGNSSKGTDLHLKGFITEPNSEEYLFPSASDQIEKIISKTEEQSSVFSIVCQAWH